MWSALRMVSSSCSTTMHGVAQVAQPAQRAEEALVVALVQPDARLVEDVEHAHEARADLGRETDALRLAARERARRRGRASGSRGPRRTRKRSRSLTSLRIGPAMSASRPAPVPPLGRTGRPWKNCSDFATGRSMTSPMPLPPSLTARLSGLSRLPPQVWHGASVMYSSRLTRTASLEESR